MKFVATILLLSLSLNTLLAQEELENYPLNVLLAQEDQENYQEVVKTFISSIKNKNKEQLAERTRFPLRRAYPLADIKDKADFLNRYEEIFDTKLFKEIITSDPAKDWSKVGWRGIMLNSGTLWLDEDGQLISINYQSQYEITKRAQLIQAEKDALHSSLQEFKEPILILKTSKFQVRIDDLGEAGYRYASWGIDNTMKEQADLVLSKGTLTFDGSGGNHYYEFINGDYKYTCFINRMSKVEAQLIVEKNGVEVLSQQAKIIRN
jgi:hypothetical protein